MQDINKNAEIFHEGMLAGVDFFYTYLMALFADNVSNPEKLLSILDTGYNVVKQGLNEDHLEKVTKNTKS